MRYLSQGYLLMFNEEVFKKILNFIHKYEFIFGFIGFFLTLLFYKIFTGPISLLSAIPGFINWFCIFLMGDWVSRKLQEGSILPRKKTQLVNFRELVIASLIMNFISDSTGSWLLKLWYFPLFQNPLIYLMIIAPMGYILFGFILYVFYRLFKHHWDYKVKKGRMKKKHKKIFHFLIHLQLVAGIFGIFHSVRYYLSFISTNNIIWYAFDQNITATVRIEFFILLWLSLFWIFEYLSFLLKKETLTRDLIRGNFIPLISIIVSSIVCIILVEFANAPFQIWIFTNWPFQEISLFKIPVVAYLLWPTQYLLLLSIIRLIDKNNSENVW